MNKSQISLIRWFARIASALLGMFVLLMILGYILEPQGSGKVTYTEIPLFIGMVAMLLGIFVSWFHEGGGAALTIGGFLIFLAQELLTSRSFNTWLLLIFPAIGLLFLLCWWQSRKIGREST